MKCKLNSLMSPVSQHCLIPPPHPHPCSYLTHNRRQLSDPRILPIVSDDGPRRVTFSASITIASIFQSDISADIYCTIHPYPPPPLLSPPQYTNYWQGPDIFFVYGVLRLLNRSQSTPLPWPQPHKFPYDMLLHVPLSYNKSYSKKCYLVYSLL